MLSSFPHGGNFRASFPISLFVFVFVSGQNRLSNFSVSPFYVSGIIIFISGPLRFPIGFIQSTNLRWPDDRASDRAARCLDLKIDQIYFGFKNGSVGNIGTMVDELI